jgi:hypothetical protein
MITGSNTNVRHRGKLFHVQTEDSGRRNPHVISHLYNGGTILASQKTRYAELLDLESETLAKDVKVLIEEQHKLMLERLKTGVYDDIIAERLGGDTAGASADPVAPQPAAPAAEAMPAPVSTPAPEVTPAPNAIPASAPTPAPQAESTRAFGDGIVSKKPLDEVILEYLVEKARDRAPDRGAPAADRSRKKE